MELSHCFFSTVSLLLSLYLVIGSTTPLQKHGHHGIQKNVKHALNNTKGTHKKGKSSPHPKHTDKHHTIQEKTHSKCVKLTLPVCHQLKEYDQATYPNLLGHTSQRQAKQAMKQFHTYLKHKSCRSHLAPFLCLLYAPPCSHLWEPVAPCRKQCEAAQHACSHLMQDKQGSHLWPSHLNCQRFPTTGGLCLGINATDHRKPQDQPNTLISLDGFKAHKGQGKTNAHRTVLENRVLPHFDQAPRRSGATIKVTKSNKHSAKSTSNKKPKAKKDVPAFPKSNAIENMIWEEPSLHTQNAMAKKKALKKARTTVEVVPDDKTLKALSDLMRSTNKIKAHTHQMRPRRYDITDLGDARLFRGWVDVQGQGAANDYCRVIGSSPKTRFLACALAGTTEQYHTFVSARGFDVGHKHSWFMRDMDGDGRDDYCRCVGHGLSSKISCMKAGKHGFHGSSTQPGNQYTFTVKKAGSCIGKTINPVLGLHTL